MKTICKESPANYIPWIKFVFKNIMHMSEIQVRVSDFNSDLCVFRCVQEDQIYTNPFGPTHELVAGVNCRVLLFLICFSNKKPSLPIGEVAFDNILEPLPHRPESTRVEWSRAHVQI